MLVKRMTDGVSPAHLGGGPVANDRHERQGEEPQRVLGERIQDLGPHASQGEEPQRVLGYPVGSIGPGPAEREWLLSLVQHPIRTYQRWLRRRRLGYYATDEEEP